VLLRYLHDGGYIAYTGIDIVETFVTHAKELFPNYDFHVGGFTDLQTSGFDIAFTRHTFEHLAPELYPKCLRAFLRTTRQLAIISWFLAPQGLGNYTFREEDSIWFNVHSSEETQRIIAEEGFDIEVQDMSFGDEQKWGHKLYLLHRRVT